MTTSAPDLDPEALAALTTEQKASLVTGASFWSTTAIEAAGVPSIMLSDGPHGLRKQSRGGDHLGIHAGEPATCFPPAVALASTWDAALVEQVGAAIAREAKAQQVSVVLGPGVNIKRSIRGGRNFEYFSEDPHLSGRLGAAWVRGAQSQGIGASVKHFAANSQETNRMRVSMDLDERTLREIELRPFQHVITTTRPWTVMCAYNAINGVSAAENRWLLTDVLRGEWGFDGVVVSDWGAVRDRAEALRAGLDLEMPTTYGLSDRRVIGAVEDGSLDPAHLDAAVRNVARLAVRATAELDESATADLAAHHSLAREAAAASIVLLKNEGAVLPLSPAGRIAVIGEFARTPRYQGAGSSLIVPTRLDGALDAIREAAPGAEVVFAAGFPVDDPAASAASAAELRREAVAAAAGADVAVVFLGLPPSAESEGFDREGIDLPAVQLTLLDEVVRANARVVVVLSNGSAVRVSDFADRVPAIVEATLLGQAGGGATADVLFGAVNPSGRLAETIPLRLEDTPDFLSFPGEDLHARWAEGVFVGYRWYDARDLDVAFPFGHGLSYTRFEWSDLQVEGDETGLDVRVTVANVGERDGHEIVQLYTGKPDSKLARAPHELRAFAKVWVPRGEQRTVHLRIDGDELATWSVRHHRFVIEGGDLEVWAAASSRDLRLHTTVAVASTEPREPLSLDSTVAEWLADPVAGRYIKAALAGREGGFDDSFMTTLAQSPVRNAAMLAEGAQLLQLLQGVLAQSAG